MKYIGVLFGMENSFPSALVERINSKNVEGIRAEFVVTGAVELDKPPHYSVIIDRISHDIPFYRAFLKHASLNGTVVINNPFWSSADDKFFNYALARKLGVAVPPTVILPHKQPPGEITDRSLRNLEFPLDWENMFACVGEHGFMKPVNGGGWQDVHHVHSREEFFRAYDQSRDLCMMYQKAIDFTSYFRCYVVGQKKVHIMPYDPRRPHAERYVADYVQGTPRGSVTKKLLKRIEQDALTLCRALGYGLNTVEFAVEGGIPYAIDFMNPVPDADIYSVGSANFEWFVEHVAELAIAKARIAKARIVPQVPELCSTAFLGSAPGGPVKKKSTKTTPKKKAAKKPKNAGLAAELEESASEQEPMGSIAAAVPGSDKRAQDAFETKKRPGAEAREIRNEPETTAGTEFKIESEKIALGKKA